MKHRFMYFRKQYLNLCRTWLKQQVDTEKDNAHAIDIGNDVA
ncbi:MAG: hypothetical protein ACC641_01255 [Acidiferrobacterales bacterium]